MLAEACWPGPLTLLLRRGPRVLDAVTGGRETVGLRVPAHPLTERLLRISGRAIAAPSANRFGRVSPTTADHVAADLGPFLDPARDVILDGGPSPVGVESTIVDCTVDPPQLLRPGGIPREDIERLVDVALADPTGPSRAAGMLASHYAPRASVELFEQRADADAAAARGPAGRAASGGHRRRATTWSPPPATSTPRLRAADEAGTDVIVAVLPPPAGSATPSGTDSPRPPRPADAQRGLGAPRWCVQPSSALQPSMGAPVRGRGGRGC